MWSFSGRRGERAALGAALLLVACGGPESPSSQPQESQSQLGGKPRAHPIVGRPPGGANTTTTPLGHLNYFGGRIIAQPEVVQVLYGRGSYFPPVQATQGLSLAAFYAEALQSSYIDVLGEYDTARQHIGRGSFNRQVIIAPAPGNDGNSLSDELIQAELSAQIDVGAIPAPDANTIYMVNVPQGRQVVSRGATSCSSGGFCGYHGTFRHGGLEVVYGVLPDLGPGSGCEELCGGGGTQFDRQTTVASEELFEAITDPEVGLAYVYGPPLGWYDLYHAEIGDICLGQVGKLSGSDGVVYQVQSLWSNSRADCISSR